MIFSGWLGGGCSGTGDCVIAITEDTAVGAVFTEEGAGNTEILLDVTKSGEGTGTVVANPEGTFVGCAGTTCSASYPVTATCVNLTATPSAGMVFQGWGGDCSGTNPVCNLDMSVNHTVEATFKKPFPWVLFTAPTTGMGVMQ